MRGHKSENTKGTKMTDNPVAIVQAYLETVRTAPMADLAKGIAKYMADEA